MRKNDRAQGDGRPPPSWACFIGPARLRNRENVVARQARDGDSAKPYSALLKARVCFVAGFRGRRAAGTFNSRAAPAAPYPICALARTPAFSPPPALQK